LSTENKKFYCGRLSGMIILEYSEYKEMNEPQCRIIRRRPMVFTFVKSTKKLLHARDYTVTRQLA